MSKQHDRITKKLDANGSAWAVRADKYCSADDPLEHQMEGRKTYHIHPDRTHPYSDCILRFRSLSEVELWLSGKHPAFDAD